MQSYNILGSFCAGACLQRWQPNKGQLARGRHACWAQSKHSLMLSPDEFCRLGCQGGCTGVRGEGSLREPVLELSSQNGGWLWSGSFFIVQISISVIARPHPQTPSAKKFALCSHCLLPTAWDMHLLDACSLCKACTRFRLGQKLCRAVLCCAGLRAAARHFSVADSWCIHGPRAQ